MRWKQIIHEKKTGPFRAGRSFFPEELAEAAAIDYRYAPLPMEAETPRMGDWQGAPAAKRTPFYLENIIALLNLHFCHIRNGKLSFEDIRSFLFVLLFRLKKPLESQSFTKN